MTIWSRETGSAVPSRVGLLTLHITSKKAEYAAIRHRISPEFIRTCNCVPMVFTAESPLAQDQYNRVVAVLNVVVLSFFFSRTYYLLYYFWYVLLLLLLSHMLFA